VNIEFRVGINMGDVVETDGNLLGDGVNIAARLEALSMPGGVSISKSVHDMIVGKTELTFKNQGLQKVKQNEFYVYDVVIDPTQTRTLKTKAKTSKAFTIGSAVVVASIAAVLFIVNPFKEQANELNKIVIVPLDTENGDQATINLGIGVTQDLTSGLSAATSQLQTLTLNEKPSDLNNLAKKVDARFILNGSLRRAGENIRISIGLIDVESMNTIWSEKYDRTFSVENIFALQDEIVIGLIDSLVGNGAVLAQAVARNVSIKGTTDLSAYECVNFVRGQYFKVLSTDLHASGLKCLRQAVIDDPNYKEAWHLLAHLVAWGYSIYAPHYQPIKKEGLSEAVQAVENAIRIDKNFARAYATRAELALYERNWDVMMRNARKAYELDPNDAYTVGHISYPAAMSGSGCKSSEEIKKKYQIDNNACSRLAWGLDRAKEANKLDEISILSFDDYGLAEAYMNTGDWDKVLTAMENVPSPDFHIWNIFIGLAHHYTGNTIDARTYLEKAREFHAPNEIENFRWLWKEIWQREVQMEYWEPVLRKYGWT